MGSMFSKPQAPPPPPPPPAVPKSVDAAGGGSDAMDDARANSTFLNSFLAGQKKNQLGSGSNRGASFLG